MDDTRIVQLLNRDEGYRDEPYLDTEGLLTIGCGLCIARNPVLGKTYKTKDEFYADYPDGIPKTKLDELLLQEIDEFTIKMADEFDGLWRDLDDVRQEVIVSLAFNMGAGWVSNFPSCVRHIKAGEFIDAAREMLHGSRGHYSKWSQQVGIRSARLALAMATGDAKSFDL